EPAGGPAPWGRRRRAARWGRNADRRFASGGWDGPSAVGAVELDQQEARVVTGLIAVVRHDRRRESADRLGGGDLVEGGSDQEVGEAGEAELLAVDAAGFVHAVGEEQHAVAGLEGLGGDL